MASLFSNKNLIWIDLEMTGLNPEKEKIIEIATIVTDSDLNILAEGPNMVLRQDSSLLELMDDWNKNHHSNSGLLDAVKISNLNEQQAEIETLDFISKFVGEGRSPMCVEIPFRMTDDFCLCTCQSLKHIFTIVILMYPQLKSLLLGG